MEPSELKQHPESLAPENMASKNQPTRWVEIWIVPYRGAAEPLPLLWQLLSHDELEAANRFHFDRLRDFYIFCRGTLRRILSSYLDLPAREIKFLYGPRGKPYLNLTGPSLEFNASHSGSLFACAISNVGPIGFDIEEIRPLSDALSIGKNFFSPAECQRLTAIPEPERIHAFFQCWTRKEAVIKATGEGVSRPLDSFEVAFGPHVAPNLLRIDTDTSPGWQMHSFNPAPGYVGALTSPSHWQTLLTRFDSNYQESSHCGR